MNRFTARRLECGINFFIAAARRGLSARLRLGLTFAANRLVSVTVAPSFKWSRIRKCQLLTTLNANGF